jgi:hypothetical protein
MVLNRDMEADSGRVVDETPCARDVGRHRPEGQELLGTSPIGRLTEGGDAPFPVEDVVQDEPIKLVTRFQLINQHVNVLNRDSKKPVGDSPTGFDLDATTSPRR